MTRLEENKIVIDAMTKVVELKPSGTYEEMVAFQLGTIATMLVDISKSLAIIADKAEKGGEDDVIDYQPLKTVTNTEEAEAYPVTSREESDKLVNAYKKVLAESEDI